MESSNSVLVEDAVIYFDADLPVLGASSVSNAELQKAEDYFQVTLPDAYKDLIRQRNGGYLISNVFTGIEGYSEINDLWVPLLKGVGGDEGIDSYFQGSRLNEELIKSWGYPTQSIVIAHFNHSGIILDYTDSKQPNVAFVDADMYPSVIKYKLAPDFLTFIRYLRRSS